MDAERKLSKLFATLLQMESSASSLRHQLEQAGQFKLPKTSEQHFECAPRELREMDSHIAYVRETLNAE